MPLSKPNVNLKYLHIIRTCATHNKINSTSYSHSDDVIATCLFDTHCQVISACILMFALTKGSGGEKKYSDPLREMKFKIMSSKNTQLQVLN